MWLELTAYDQNGKVIDQSGKIADDAAETNPQDSDIPLWSFNDRIFDAHGKEVHMFWDVAPSAAHPDGFESRSLPGPRSAAPGTHTLTIPLQLSAAIPGRVELRVRIRPVGFDVLQDLVDSGDLDAGVRKQVPTLTVFSAVVTWKKGATSAADLTLTQINGIDCNSYRCTLDPSLSECRSR